MQRAGLASFVSGAGLYIVFAFPFYVRGPLHLRVSIFAPRLARQHREHIMAGTIAPISFCEESLLIRRICATYRACPARARWRKIDGSVAHPAEYFLGGGPVIGTYPGGHRAVRRHSAGHQPPYSSFPLESLEFVRRTKLQEALRLVPS